MTETATKTFPVIYRCKAKKCPHVARLVFTATGTESRPGFRGERYEVKVSGFVQDHRFYPWTKAVRYGLVPACPTHGLDWITSNAVKGTFTDSVKCDARCEGAKGPNCECSCGGANHGAAHNF